MADPNKEYKDTKKSKSKKDKAKIELAKKMAKRRKTSPSDMLQTIKIQKRFDKNKTSRKTDLIGDDKLTTDYQKGGYAKKVKKLRLGGDTMGGPNDKSKSSPGPDRSKVSSEQESNHQRNTKSSRTSTDVPFKKPLDLKKNIALSMVIPFGGPLVNYAAKQNYKARQKFARKQGLYRDAYRTTGKTLQPNSKIGKDYLKDAGFGKRTETIANNNGSDKPILPIPETPIEKIKTASYKKPTVVDGVFNYSVGLKKGGMLRQGKPKLAKKGWK